MNKTQNRLKILMLIPELGYGGAEKSFIRLSKLLSQYHDVTIVVFQRYYAKAGYSSDSDEINVPIIVLDENEKVGKIKRWWRRWKHLLELKNKNDITISFLTGANILNTSIFSISKTVISLRGSRRFDPAFSTLKRCLYEYVIDPITFILSDKIVSVSEGLTSELGMHVDRWTKKKIVTIEVFIDAEQMIATAMEPIEEETEILGSFPLIVSTGRLSPEKGFTYLITVFAKLKQNVPGAKLVLIGDGPELQFLCEQCEIKGLSYSLDGRRLNESDVVFLGYRKNPIRYYKIADVFVLSSLTEGFPNGVIEALAAGITVIASNGPWGARSVLSKNPDVSSPYPTVEATNVDYGILMPRIDQEKYENTWVNTLTKVLLEDEKNSKGSRQSTDRVRELDMKVIGEKWLNLIDELGVK